MWPRSCTRRRPLAERRAQALSLDRSVLAELLGREELRDLIDHAALADLELELRSCTPERKVRDPDGLHDALRLLGDLTVQEAAARSADPDAAPGWLAELEASRRAVRLRVGGQGAGWPSRTWPGSATGWGRLRRSGCRRRSWSRWPTPSATCWPATPAPTGRSWPTTRPAGSGWAWPSWSRPWPGWRRPAGSCRASSAPAGRAASGSTPRCCGGRRRSLAALRREVEPVPTEAMARFLQAWQGVGPAGPRSADLDALFRVVEQLQGAAVPASALERQVLAARLPGYHPGLLDQLCASGEVVWAGAGALGSDDGWVGLYLAEGALLLPEPLPVELSPLAAQVRDDLATGGAMFFRQLSDSVAPPNDSELLLAVWELVWAGHVTNDTLAPLRALVTGGSRPTPPPRPHSPLRPPGSHRPPAPAPAAAGRWSLVPAAAETDPTRRLHAVAEQLLDRHGVLTRGRWWPSASRAGSRGCTRC